LAAVPSLGRAARVERPAAPGSDATRDLYERFSGQIFGYCLHQLASREEAEDAVQTTFMNAFRGLQRGIVPQVESAWLFKIAHNVCLSRRRSTRRRGKIEAPNNFEVLQEVVPARERMGDELIRLQDVLEEMPESQRRAILLREWQGLSYREIAEELELSQSAVETLIFRARRALATGLEVEPEQRTWRKRARHGLDAGGLVAALKALLTGGTAVKVAATIAVATTAAVAVSEGHHHAARHARVQSTPTSQAATAAPSRSTSSVRLQLAPTRVSPPHRTLARSSITPSPVPAQQQSTARTAVTAPLSSAPATSAAATDVKPGHGYGRGHGKAHGPKPATKSAHRAQAPTPTDPAPPASAAKDNPAKGRDKQPPQRATQAVAQPAPTQNDNGNGHG